MHAPRGHMPHSQHRPPVHACPKRTHAPQSTQAAGACMPQEATCPTVNTGSQHRPLVHACPKMTHTPRCMHAPRGQMPHSQHRPPVHACPKRTHAPQSTQAVNTGPRCMHAPRHTRLTVKACPRPSGRPAGAPGHSRATHPARRGAPPLLGAPSAPAAIVQQSSRPNSSGANQTSRACGL
jgi:hypothetical protein